MEFYFISFFLKMVKILQISIFFGTVSIRINRRILCLAVRTTFGVITIYAVTDLYQRQLRIYMQSILHYYGLRGLARILRRIYGQSSCLTVWQLYKRPLVMVLFISYLSDNIIIVCDRTTPLQRPYTYQGFVMVVNNFSLIFTMLKQYT